jgi:hypothetical protein
MDFPRAHVGPGTVDSYFRGQIGGEAAEIWHRRYQRSTDPVRVRSEPDVHGYETFALWRERGVYLQGSGRTLDDIALLRLVFQTVRFGNASAFGQ